MSTATAGGVTMGYDDEGDGPVRAPGLHPGAAGPAAPALVAVGTEDAFTPVSDAEYMNSLIGRATLAVIPGSGHLPNLERPAEFNQALRRFLAGLPAGPGTSAGAGARTPGDGGE